MGVMRYWSLLLAAVLLACASDDPEPAKACAPGQQVECACPGGSKGAQVCNADGTGYGACSPCDVAAGGAGGSSAFVCNHEATLDRDCVNQVDKDKPIACIPPLPKELPKECVKADFGILCCAGSVLLRDGDLVQDLPRRAVEHEHR